jgi:Tfp pilus assembly protein PilE
MRIQAASKYFGKSSAGFTLAEAMISVLIGSIMLTALYSSFSFGFATVKLAREDLRATQILVQRLEIMRLTTFDDILKKDTITEYYDPNGVTNSTAGAGYTVVITSKAPNASDMPVQPVYYMSKMLKITATATWTNSNQLRSRTLQTYAAQSGIQSYVYSHK